MRIPKHAVALPLALAILTACDSASTDSKSALHEQTPANSTTPVVAEDVRCEAVSIPNWNFYDYCACVDSTKIAPEVIDEQLGLGATASMRIFKKVHESKAKAVIAAASTASEVKGRICLATGLLYERESGSPNSPIRKELDRAGEVDASVLNRRLALAQSGMTSPAPIRFLSKLGSGTSPGIVRSVDLSYNKLSDTFFAPLRGINWISTFGIKEIDLSNNELETTNGVDFDFTPNTGTILNSVDLAYNKIKIFQAWQSGKVAELSYLNLSHNPEFKADGFTSSGAEVKLGKAIAPYNLGDTTELFLDLSYTATDSLTVSDTNRIFSGLNLDNLQFKADARVGLQLNSIPAWITARNSKNIAKAISVDSQPSKDRQTKQAAYLNLDGAKGLENLQFLRDVTGVIGTQFAFVSAVGSDLSSFSATPLDLASIEFFSVDGSSIESLGESFTALKYASSTGIKDASYVNNATALEGAVIDSSTPCPPNLGARCKTNSFNGQGRLADAGVGKYVENFCKETFGSADCTEAAKGIIGGGVADAELSKKADEYMQNWCKSTFDKSCELAANVAP